MSSVAWIRTSIAPLLRIQAVGKGGDGRGVLRVAGRSRCRPYCSGGVHVSARGLEGVSSDLSHHHMLVGRCVGVRVSHVGSDGLMAYVRGVLLISGCYQACVCMCVCVYERECVSVCERV